MKTNLKNKKILFISLGICLLIILVFLLLWLYMPKDIKNLGINNVECITATYTRITINAEGVNAQPQKESYDIILEKEINNIVDFIKSYKYTRSFITKDSFLKNSGNKMLQMDFYNKKSGNTINICVRNESNYIMINDKIYKFSASEPSVYFDQLLICFNVNE